VAAVQDDAMALRDLYFSKLVGVQKTLKPMLV
jgi:hypothetical protein